MKFTFHRTLIYFFLPFVLVGCLGYKSFHINGYHTKHRPVLKKGIETNDVYVHTKDQSYKMKSPVLEGDELVGKLEIIKDSTLVDSLKLQDEKVSKGDFRLHAINIYTDSVEISEERRSYDEASSSNELNETRTNNSINNDRSRVQLNEASSIHTYVSDSDRVGIILLIILGAVVALLLLIWLILLLIAKAADDTGKASSESSGASSGGDGSCYIATMSYGSYDAPEVITLRNFRDRFLKKHQWGRNFITYYYRTAPKFVKKHKRNKAVHRFIRFNLNAFVALLRLLKF